MTTTAQGATSRSGLAARLQGVSGPELGFLIASQAGAVLFFAASALAFRSLSYAEFGALSGTLAIGTFIAAGSQLGAGYELPRLARRSPESAASAYLGFLACSLMAGGLITSVGLVIFAGGGFQRWALPFGLVAGAHLVSDGFLRATGALTRLWQLNLVLHAALVISTVFALGFGVFDPLWFLFSVMAIKVAFTLAVAARTGRTNSFRVALTPVRSGLAGGTSIVVTVFGLGILDVLAVTAASVPAGTYLSARHFGYGIFIAVVQEGLLPVLVGRLTSRTEIDHRSMGLASLGVSAVVGVGAIVVAIVLAVLKQELTADYTAAALYVGLGLMAHTNAVFALKVGYVCNRLSIGRTTTYIAAAAVTVGAAVLGGAGLAALSLTWAGVNGGIALVQYRANRTIGVPTRSEPTSAVDQ